MAASTARKPSETRSSVPLIKLNDGNTIPQLGMGVWQVDPEITARVVRDGIAAGYRLIDTAEGYHNEEGRRRGDQHRRGAARRALHHQQAAQWRTRPRRRRSRASTRP